MSLSTHVLDTARGRPAGGVQVRLEAHRDGGWHLLAEGRTDADGRLAGWDVPDTGAYRLIFGTGEYLGADGFYPEVTVAFMIADAAEHYHVPLLLSPYGFTTYRGS